MARGDVAEGPRHEARERALSLLYEAAIKQVDPAVGLAELPVEPDPFAVDLVRGVAGDHERIDRLVAEAAVGWQLARMPVVDRTVLRLATYELLQRPDIPVAVVIDEAVELAKRYSTEQSGGVVNGVLATLARPVRSRRRHPAPGLGPTSPRPQGRPRSEGLHC